MEVLKIKNLTKMYDDKNGIKDISLSLEEKECIAILGKSGTGKSTLLKTILNRVDKDSGRVSFFDTTLKADYVDVIRSIGYLPDKPYDYPKKTIKDFIKIINKYYNLDYDKEIKHYLEEFNLDENELITNLSSGSLQKLSIILAIFHNPKILLLDEPTNFLDTSSISTLTNILKKLKYAGTSIIIVSHHLSFILGLANKIYLLHNNSLLDLKDRLKVNNYKKISVILNRPITYQDINIKGITNININQNSASFIYSDKDMSPVIKKLFSLPVIDLSIENPQVEDIIGGLLYDIS